MSALTPTSPARLTLRGEADRAVDRLHTLYTRLCGISQQLHGTQPQAPPPAAAQGGANATLPATPVTHSVNHINALLGDLDDVVSHIEDTL